jgi:hypothetical protein
MIDLEQAFGKKRRENSVIVYNNDEIDFRSFAFVVNVKELVNTDSVAIAPGYTLRKAHKTEIEYIKEFLKENGTRYGTGVWEDKPTASGKVPKLPKKLWRYFVIEFENDDPNLDLLEAALAVAPSSLDIGFAKIKVNVGGGLIRPACLYHAPRLYQSLSALYLANTGRDKLLVSIGNAEGSQINDGFRLMVDHDHGILDLTRVLELVLDLKDLPHSSPLQILGYFAILESVLTHQPRPDDRYESLTRQITNKLALLNNRWNPPFDYSPLNGAKHENIWPQMYAYRSAIAHGNKLDFKTRLTLLKNADVANTLIIDAVKKTIRQAYVEPRLLKDLHDV